MQLIVGFCRYALPLLGFIILFKCLLTLLIGHPVNKTYGYIVNSINGEKIPLNTWETSIGRSKSCDIILTYGTVSRFHAAICRRVDGWYLFDTNSKLGTYVNGEKISGEATIKNADVITFGDCNFHFVITDDPVIEVGKKRRKNKKQYAQPQDPTPNNIQYKRQETDFQPQEPKPTEERYDDFESIHIDFHPKSSRNETNLRGDIRDVYSDANSYASEYENAHNAYEAPSYNKQAAIVNLMSGETFLLCGNRISVGRSRNSDIKLSSQSVSRNHALIFNNNGSWYISDSGSTYGTYIGNNKVTSSPVMLYDGAIIRLSDTEIKFVADYR